MRHILWALLAVTLYVTEIPASHAIVQANIVVDVETGRVIQESNADRTTYPASLTKMMTLYMVFEALDSNRLKLGDRLPVSAYASGRAPTKLGLQPGETITVQNAILGMVTKSANDAAAVVAERIGGSEDRFAAMMTERAHKLGMEDTTFHNASGLPHRGQVTTARDMAILSVALLRDFPQYYKFFSTESFTYKGLIHNNHNHLMERYQGMDGIKTGFINASGFNLAASVERNGRRLVAVVMGGVSARSRDAYMETVLDANFQRLARDDQARTLLASAEPLQPPANAEPRPAKIIRAASANQETPHLEAGIGSAAIAGLATSEIAALNRLARRVAAADAPAARTAPAGQWAVQLASFSSRGKAHQAVARATRAVPALKESPHAIHAARINKKTVYRAKFVGLSEDAARQACVKLKPMAGCTVMPADGFAQSASTAG